MSHQKSFAPRRARRRRRWLRRLGLVAAGLLCVLLIASLIHFPGRQARIAFSLVTGLGVPGIQQRVDALEDKAITGEPFTDDDRAFLDDLYTCFAKLARLSIVLRQSGELMDHYLGGSGEAVQLEPRIFLGSRPVRERMAALKAEIAADLGTLGRPAAVYTTPTFYMGDPEFFEAYVGLYFGRLSVEPRMIGENTIELRWRADMPWQWPTYESLRRRHGDYHAQNFALPNARSVLFGPRHCLRMDDGLGEHLTQLNLAAPFNVTAEWAEQRRLDELTVPTP